MVKTNHIFVVLKRLRSSDVFVTRVNRGCDPPLYNSRNVLCFRVAGEFENFDDARELAQKLRKKK